MAKKRIPLADRFWAKVRKDAQCWIWTNNADNDGYGKIRLGGMKRCVLAHRVSWEMHNGPIPDGMLVLHRCDNPPCVNPEHLFLGTDADNMQDMIAKGRQRGNKKLTEAQVLEIRAQWIPWRVTCAQLAEKYGVSRFAVVDIVRRRSWPNL